MALKLNGVPEDHVKKDLDKLAVRVPEMLERFGDTTASNRMYMNGAVLFQWGAGIYQQEGDPDEASAKLAQAAEWMLRALEVRETPTAEDHRRAQEALRAASLLVCFGTAEQRARFTALRYEQYCAWTDQEGEELTPIMKPVGDVTRLLQQYLREGTVSQGEASPLMEYLAGDGIDRYQLSWTLPLAQGLVALSSDDAAGLETAVKALEKNHARDAKRGDFKLLYDGFLCEQALMLVQLGREKGLEVSIDSPYVPVQLLPGAS